MVVREGRGRDTGILVAGIGMGLLAAVVVGGIARLRRAERSAEGRPQGEVPELGVGRPAGENRRLDGVPGVFQSGEPPLADLSPELTFLRLRLREHPDGVDVELGLLAPGIVEVAGSVPDGATARWILHEVGRAAGVRTVVNRLWVEGDRT